MGKAWHRGSPFAMNTMQDALIIMHPYKSPCSVSVASLPIEGYFLTMCFNVMCEHIMSKMNQNASLSRVVITAGQIGVSQAHYGIPGIFNVNI